MKRALLHITIVFLAVSALALPVHALNEIGIGVRGGLTYDQNNLEDEIRSYNSALETYKNANPGTELSQLNIPYVGVLGVSLTFKIKFFLIRTGFHYSEAFFYSTMGFIVPAGGSRNTVRFNTWQIGVPLSVGFLLEASRRCIFYFGGGFSTYFVYLEIKQSRPDPALGLPSSIEKDTFNTHLFGFHLFIGAEFPVIIKRLSISAEWVFQRGISEPVKSGRSSSKRTIDVTGNQLVFGINYYFTI